jgi:hypothetical protein
MFLKRDRWLYNLLRLITFSAVIGFLITACGTAGAVRSEPDGSGSGTRRDPFIVASEATLRQVGTGINGWTLDAWYRQAAAIELTGGNWVRIGTNTDDPASAFTGVYDGRGFTISGFNYETDVILFGTSNDTEGHGMFGSVAAPGALRNLTLIGDVTVNIIPGAEDGIGRVIGTGGVTGWLNGGTLENVTFKGSVRSGSGRTFTDPFGNALSTGYHGHRTGNTVGGIVGGVISTTSRVIYCHAEAIVIGYFQVGGVIGSLENAIRNTNHSVIRDNSFTPPSSGIDGTAFVISGTNRVGLVIGNMGDFTVAQRLSSAGRVRDHIMAVSYPNYDARNIGGIAGGVIGRSFGTYIQ